MLWLYTVRDWTDERLVIIQNLNVPKILWKPFGVIWPKLNGAVLQMTKGYDWFTSAHLHYHYPRLDYFAIFLRNSDGLMATKVSGVSERTAVALYSNSNSS